MTEHMETSEELKFKRGRNGDEHIKNCADGYYKSDIPSSFEIHHALCVHACSDSTFPTGITDDEVKFIYACFAISVWNINGPDNNIGLPKKWAYVLDPDDRSGWDGYPCHQVDHDLYLKAVEEYVTNNVWKKVKKAKKKENCKKLTGANIASKFNTGSKHWKAFLKARGKGTKACLDYCLKGKSDPVLERTWHIPFSMAPDGEVRKRVKPRPNRILKRLGLLIQAIK